LEFNFFSKHAIIYEKGFKEWAITWLKETIQQGKYTDSHNHHKTIEVFMRV